MAAENSEIDKETINRYFEYKKADLDFLDACRVGDEIIVDLLINLGINVDKIYDNRYTPLIEACRENQYGVVDLLIKAGADVNLFLSGEITDLRMWNYFRIPLYVAIYENNYFITKKLLQAGAKIDVNDDFTKYSALHYAASCDFYKGFKLLIKYGCNINSKDSTLQASTPLHYAARSGNKKSIQKLISLGADINAKNADDESKPIHEAVDGGHIQSVKLLIDKGAKVDSLDKSGMTPLFWAVSMKNKKMVEFLISKGADPTITTNHGETIFDILNEEDFDGTVDPGQRRAKKIGNYLLSNVWNIQEKEDETNPKRQRLN